MSPLEGWPLSPSGRVRLVIRVGTGGTAPEVLCPVGLLRVSVVQTASKVLSGTESHQLRASVVCGFGRERWRVCELCGVWASTPSSDALVRRSSSSNLYSRVAVLNVFLFLESSDKN